MRGSHVVKGEDGRPSCKYCHRPFKDEPAAEAHVRELARMGMLQDHIAIHWTTARW